MTISIKAVRQNDPDLVYTPVIAWHETTGKPRTNLSPDSEWEPTGRIVMAPIAQNMIVEADEAARYGIFLLAGDLEENTQQHIKLYIEWLRHIQKRDSDVH